MAKQKTFHSKLVAKVKRDARYCWNVQNVNEIRVFFERMRPRKPIPAEDEKLLGEGFLCLQQEAFIRSFYEDWLFGDIPIEELDDTPLVYPGLMVGWETRPKTMELDAEAASFLKSTELDFLDTPIEVLKRPFPGCLLIDTRSLGFSLYGTSADGVFVYPSYDLDCRYAMLLMVGVSLKQGLHFPLEAKLVLKGRTLGEAIEFSKSEHERLRKLVLSGFDDGMHGEVFSPLAHEGLFVEFASRVLAFSFGDCASVEEKPLSSGMSHLRVLLRHQEGALQVREKASEVEPDTGMPQLVKAEEAFGIAAIEDEAIAEAAAPVEAEASVEPEPAPHDLAESDEPDFVEKDPLDYDALMSMVEELLAENAALKDAVGAVENQNASLGYHLKQAQSSVERLRAEVDALRGRAELVEVMTIPETPLEALELAERAFSDRLIIMNEARRSARDFERGSTSETWAVLQAMAVTLHRLVFRQTSGNLTHAFQAETGFEITLRDVKHTNKNAEYAKERRVLYAGQERDVTAHVKGKGVKKGESLRVHFFADYAADKIVIAHCGEHLTTIETSRL